MSADFYIKLPMREKNEKQVGQVFWVPCPMHADATFTLRIGNWKAGEDISEARLSVKRVNTADLGKICAGERVDMERMVLPELKLDSSEDLVVNRVKRRPAVLISKDCYNLRKFADIASGLRSSAKLGPNRLIFAPVYSLRKEEHQSKSYPEAFIQKLTADHYPTMLFLPAYGTVMKNDSMLVLSELFSVNFNAADPTDWCIDPVTFAMKFNQFDEYVMHQAEELQCALEG